MAASEAATMFAHIWPSPTVAKLLSAGSRRSPAMWPGVFPFDEAVGLLSPPTVPFTLTFESRNGDGPPARARLSVRLPGPALIFFCTILAGRPARGLRSASIELASAVYHHSRSLAPL